MRDADSATRRMNGPKRTLGHLRASVGFTPVQAVSVSTCVRYLPYVQMTDLGRFADQSGCAGAD